MNNGYILFYDSGIGGLSTLKEAMKILPNEKFIYFADNKNMPYGNKTKEEIIGLVSKTLEGVFKRFKIKMLVFACNTITTCAIESFRARYSIDIVGTEPAIKLAMRESKTKEILVLSTLATSSQERLKKLKREARGKVFVCPLKNFAAEIEYSVLEKQPLCIDSFMKKIRKILEKRPNIDGIVLGCTHYCFYKAEIEKMTGIKCYDGNVGVAKRIKSLLETKNCLNDKKGKELMILLTKSGKNCHKYWQVLGGVEKII